MSDACCRRYGRFHVLRGESAEAPPVHARIQKGDAIELIVGASVFSGALTEDNMFVVGMAEAPSPDFVSVLLSAPCSIARFVQREVGDEVQHFVELSCWDECNVQAQMVIGIKAIDGKVVIADALCGLVTALAAMEAVLQEVETERTANANQCDVNADGTTMDNGVLARLYQPIVVKGKALQSHGMYKKTVLRDVVEVGNRAYYQASEACGLRDEVRAQMERRRQSEKRARASKRERRQSILRQSNVRRSSVASKISFFDDTPVVSKEEPDTVEVSTTQPLLRDEENEGITPEKKVDSSSKQNIPAEESGVMASDEHRQAAKLQQLGSTAEEKSKPTPRRRKKKPRLI